MSSFLTLGADLARNLSKTQQLAYVVEAANWSVKWDGRYLTEALNEQRLLAARTTTLPIGIRSGIIHFGSFRTVYFRNRRYGLSGRSRKVLTVFHVQPNNPQYSVLSELASELAYIHTSCTATKKDLLALGVREEQITVIPLGVDLRLFQPGRIEERHEVRRRFNIPEDAFVIGSFQKDGTGWEAGMKPKLEKGPDIFVQAMALAKNKIPVHVLLVGPARGYVVKGLQEQSIPFTHIGYVADYAQLPLFYRMLDAYVISSRVEGGPKALLESWACGIPVVATRMGMVADVAEHERDALIYEVEDVRGLARGIQTIAEDRSVREAVIRRGREKVVRFAWQTIARRYYDTIYSRLL